MTFGEALYVIGPFVVLAVCYGMVKFYEREQQPEPSSRRAPDGAPAGQGPGQNRVRPRAAGAGRGKAAAGGSTRS